MQPATTPRDRLFQTAARLFFQRGYRAVGVDTIAAESGVGKMTLYRHFPSKEDLIVAFLRHTDEEFWGYFNQSTTTPPTAREKLAAYFEALQAYTTSPACYGCAFLNIAAEFPDGDDAAHQIAREHKQAVWAKLRELAGQAGAREPGDLADALLLLMDGAYIAARMYGATPANPARSLAATARQVIAAHCDEPRRSRDHLPTARRGRAHVKRIPTP